MVEIEWWMDPTASTTSFFGDSHGSDPNSQVSITYC